MPTSDYSDHYPGLPPELAALLDKVMSYVEEAESETEVFNDWVQETGISVAAGFGMLQSIYVTMRMHLPEEALEVLMGMLFMHTEHWLSDHPGEMFTLSDSGLPVPLASYDDPDHAEEMLDTLAEIKKLEETDA